MMHLRTQLEAGKSILNGWLHIPSAVSAEVMAHAGFNTLTLDLQHGLIHYESALTMLQGIASTGTPTLARVPWNEPGIIMKLLDAGCVGIVCPMVNTREEAERFVQACRYPPLGYRSYGPTRARLLNASYAATANKHVLTFAMIETAEALQNVEAIARVEGLDALYVGPADLSQSLGGPPGADFEEGPVADALEVIKAAAKRRGKVAGLHSGSSRYARKMIKQGFQFVTVQSDFNFLAEAAKEMVAAVRGGDDKPAEEKPTPPGRY